MSAVAVTVTWPLSSVINEFDVNEALGTSRPIGGKNEMRMPLMGLLLLDVSMSVATIFWAKSVLTVALCPPPVTVSFGAAALTLFKSKLVETEVFDWLVA